MTNTSPSAVPINVSRLIVMRSRALLSTSVPCLVASSRLVVHATMRLKPAAGWVRTVKKLKTANTSP